MRTISIKGTGSYIPEKVVPNSYFESILETTDEWITTRTGIKERRNVLPGQALSDMVIPASNNALEMAGISADQLDLIIVGTVSGDMPTPSTACFVQQGLGAKKATPFDISAACPGFIYGLSIAEKFIQDGSHEYALVIGGEVISNRLDYEDRGTCLLFGDGAGAAVVGPSDGETEGELLSSHLHADGSLWDLLYLPGCGSRHPASHEMIDEKLHLLKMKGGEVFKFAVRCLTEVSVEALEHNGITSDQIDWFIPHQANLRIMEVVAKRLEIPMEKIILTVQKYGNTSAATIPTALDEAVREGKIKRGDLVLTASFGAGFTWGSNLFRF